MFKFQFLEDDVPGETNEEDKNVWFESKEIQPDFALAARIQISGSVNKFDYDSGVVNYLNPNLNQALDDKLEDFPYLKADKDHSDLVTGIYEGGFKVWECTWDLTKFICSEKLNFESKHVLDLGCGSGIVGILAYQKGAQLCFQDYNEEIVKFVTVPNVVLNAQNSEDVQRRCKFYSGDWKSFLDKYFESENNKFDFIFTSETIYNPCNYKKLHDVFRKCLKENGVVYLAAKSHYFGVGGGTRQFEEFLRKENVFKFSTCWSSSNGLQRQILKINF